MHVCDIDGRLVTSGDKYATIVTAIDLKLDRVTRDVVSARATEFAAGITRRGSFRAVGDSLD